MLHQGGATPINSSDSRIVKRKEKRVIVVKDSCWFECLKIVVHGKDDDGKGVPVSKSHRDN